MKRRRESYRVTFDTTTTARAVYLNDGDANMQIASRQTIAETRADNSNKKLFSNLPTVLQQLVKTYICNEGRTELYMMLFDNLPPNCQQIIDLCFFDRDDLYGDINKMFPLENDFACYSCKIMFSKIGPEWDDSVVRKIQERDVRSRQLTGDFHWRGFCSHYCADECYYSSIDYPKEGPYYI